MHPLVAFYRGEGTDHRGRTLNNILAFADSELESCHDYIQWLFPLRTLSDFNPEAPVVTDEVMAEFVRDEMLQLNVHRSLLRMLQFYGVVLKESPQGLQLIIPYDIRQHHWMTRDNHNHRRLSRIMTSMQLFGLENQVRALWQGLQQLVQEYPQAFTPETQQYWLHAVTSD